MQTESSVSRFVIEVSENTRHCAERLEVFEGLLGEYRLHNLYFIQINQVLGLSSQLTENNAFPGTQTNQYFERFRPRLTILHFARNVFR